MQEVLFNILAEHFGFTAALMVALFVGICWLLYKYAVNKTRNECKMEALPCDDHHELLNAHENVLNELREQFGYIKGQLESLMKFLATQNVPFSPDTYSKKKSPRSLNENGRKLVADVNGDGFVKANKDFLFKQIDAFRPQTAYDVEMAALAALRINQDKAVFNQLKNWVYNAPARELADNDGNVRMADVTLGDVLFVISLELRDAYLQERSGIKD